MPVGLSGTNNCANGYEQLCERGATCCAGYEKRSLVLDGGPHVIRVAP